MRSGARWGDVCIVNISSRGLGLQAAQAPERGTYIEVRKGMHVIVARVAWSDRYHRFGVCAQERLCADTLVNDAAPISASAAWPAKDRRSAPRVSLAAADHSRHAARAMQFLVMGIAVSGAALALFGWVEQTFAATLTVVEAELSAGG